MNTREIRDKIYKSQNGNITGPAEDDLHDICGNLCDALDSLESRIRRIEGDLSVYR